MLLVAHSYLSKPNLMVDTGPVGVTNRLNTSDPAELFLIPMVDILAVRLV
jgi:hypothetical protein